MIALQPLSDAVLCSQALLVLEPFAGSVGSLLGHQRGIRTPISMSTEQEPDLAERDYGQYEGRRAARLAPEDVLVDAMRGRSTTGPRSREPAARARARAPRGGAARSRLRPAEM